MKMPEDSCQNGFSRTFMLFESGNVVSVDLSLFSAPKENIRPIDAYVVTEADGTVTHSARRAAGAVYEVAGNEVSEMGPIVAGFDFKADFPVTGESGGLAFAVALAKRLFNKDPGPVGATGIVETSYNGGPVKKVRGIEAKLKAAGLVLPSGGWIFYPQENEHEVSPELRKNLMGKGLKLYPVSSVAQTLEILFSKSLPNNNDPDKKNRWNQKKVMPIFLFLIVLVLTGGLILWQDRHLPSDQINTEKSGSVSDQDQNEIDSFEIENKGYEKKGNIPDNGYETVQDPEEGFFFQEGAEIGEETLETDDLKTQENLVSITIFGKTRLNMEISKVLTTKLKNFFSLPHHHLGPVENVTISGQVLVLRIEENWIEERQQFRSNIRVSLRDFVYEDHTRKVERPDIEVTVYARGMVEDMIPLAAQELMNKLLDSLISDKNDDFIPDPSES